MSRFICFFHYLGLWSWQLGLNVYARAPNLELHVPFGFFKIGWESNIDRVEVEDKYIRTIGFQHGRWQVVRYDEEDE